MAVSLSPGSAINANRVAIVAFAAARMADHTIGGEPGEQGTETGDEGRS